jgi:hypothetical protein
VVEDFIQHVMVKAKFKGNFEAQSTYVANICAPRMPMVLGMPSIVKVDENNFCNIVCMLADYLSRLMGAKEKIASISVSTHFKQIFLSSRCSMMTSKCSTPS